MLLSFQKQVSVSKLHLCYRLQSFQFGPSYNFVIFKELSKIPKHFKVGLFTNQNSCVLDLEFLATLMKKL